MICQVLLYGQSYWARRRLEIGRSVPTLLYTAAMLLSVWQPHCFFLRHFIILSASELVAMNFLINRLKVSIAHEGCRSRSTLAGYHCDELRISTMVLFLCGF